MVKSTDCFLEVLSSIPSKLMVAHNHLQCDLTPSFGVSDDSDRVLTYVGTAVDPEQKAKQEKSLSPPFCHLVTP